MPVERQQIGPYRFQQLLGYGSLGEVYLVEDTRNNRQDALKLLRAGATTSAQEVRFFETEAKTISQFNHPHILPLLDYGETTIDGAQVPYVVTPFCPEGTLVTWLKQNSSTGVVSPQDASAMVRQAADALQYAHNYGIVHQDIKPSNLFIRGRTAGIPDIWVGDFGLAQITRDEGNTNVAVRGTPTYIAPEQWIGHPVPATDQYALAVLTYQLLTGQSPFQGNREQLKYAHNNLWPPPPSTINPTLPSEVDGVIRRALAKRPGDRFNSVTAFADALQQAITGVAPGGGLPVQGQVVLPAYRDLSNEPAPFYGEETVAANAVSPAPQPQRSNVPPAAPPEPSPYPPEPERRSTNTALIVLIAALVIVLLVGSVVLFFVLKGNNTGTLAPANATATALANVTATAQTGSQTATANAGNAKATATAAGSQNAATATARANANATAQANNAKATATAQANANATGTATAATATVQPASQFNGNWVNDNSAQTRGVSRLNITNSGLTIHVQALGKCGTADCLWGTQDVPYRGNQFTATFTSNTGSQERLIISMNNPNSLQVIDNDLTDNTTQTFTFHKM